MSRVLAILFLTVSLAGTGLVILLLQERDSLTTRLVQTEAELKRAQSESRTLREERDRLRSEAERQSASSLATKSRTPATADATPAQGSAGKAKAGPEAFAGQGRKALAEMMKNPAMREMMKQQQLAALDMQYGGLLAQFQLNEAEKADFKQLLAERMMLESELGLSMMGEDVTKEQRDAALKEYQEGKKTSDARIRDFLNSDGDYAVFQHWEDTKPERMQIEMGRSQFVTSGEALTPQQEQQLVDAMHQVRMAPNAVPDLSRPENFDPSRLNDTEIDRQLAQFDANTQAVLRSAAAFLSPKQLEALRAMQQQWRSMAEAGMRMSAMMFQPGKGPAGK